MIGRYEREAMERERSALLDHHAMGELTRAGARRLDELNRKLFHFDMAKKRSLSDVFAGATTRGGGE